MNKSKIKIMDNYLDIFEFYNSLNNGPNDSIPILQLIQFENHKIFSIFLIK